MITGLTARFHIIFFMANCFTHLIHFFVNMSESRAANPVGAGGTGPPPKKKILSKTIFLRNYHHFPELKEVTGSWVRTKLTFTDGRYFCKQSGFYLFYKTNIFAVFYHFLTFFKQSMK